MKILKYIKFLEEINLNLGELNKPGKESNTKRGDVLVDKLEDPEQTLNIAGEGPKNITNIVINGSDKPTEDAVSDITTRGKYDPIKAKDVFTKGNRYTKVLKDNEGDSYALNQVVKDKEFGSVGPGTKTRLNETLQSLYLALKISEPQTPLTVDNLFDFITRYKANAINNIDLFLTNINGITKEDLEAASSNRDWAATFVQIPEAIYAFKDSTLFDDSSYSIFHISNKSEISPVLQLIKRFNFVKKKKVNDPETGIEKENDLRSVDFSKFCPADVYVVKTENIEEINSAIKTASTVQDLSNVVDNNFDDRKMIAISLKKIKSTTGAPSFKVIINKEQGTKPPTFDIDNFIVTKEPLRGIGSRISAKSKWTTEDEREIEKGTRSMTIDSTNTSYKNDVCGEIDGAIARHGKVSFSVIKSKIDAIRQIEDFSHIANINNYDELNRQTEEVLRNAIKRLWKRLLRSGKSEVNIYGTMLGRDYGTVNVKNKLISKLQSLQILYVIYQISSIDKSTADELVTSIMSYALSININMFSTPRYIRII